MTPPDFKQVEQVFQQVRRLSASERSAILDRECAQDPDLRAEVESLLLEHDRESREGVFDQPVLGDEFKVDAPTGASGEPLPRSLPTTFGDYRIQETLGEGGMGVVYLAEQQNPRRRVALKVLRSVAVGPDLARRFDLEAQVLARLKHPGIAQIYEAGIEQTEVGLCPFIAMELVTGSTLRVYLDREKPSVETRLTLFIQICAAVEHAHQRGVIHRDLKPGNILVDTSGDEPTIRVLDFGIARLSANAATLATPVPATISGQLLGTVQYMSPEQATGDIEHLDTRSDVYALGVILYEMLVGQLPYELASRTLHEAVRIICETEPTPLERVDPTLRGDLATITDKALQKEPDRRYSTAAELSADVRRSMVDEPILAQPPSATYQLRKFARRNKGFVAAVSIILVLMFIAIVGTSSQAVIASRARRTASDEKERAERRFNDVRELVNEFIFSFDSELAKLSGSLEARQMLVQTGLSYLDRLATEATDDAGLMYEIAAGYSKLGDVQGAPTIPNLGDHEGSLASYEKARDMIEIVMKIEPENRAAQYLAAKIALQAGDVFATTGSVERRDSNFMQALVISQAVLASVPDDVEGRLIACRTYERMGNAALSDRDLDAARQHYEAANRISADLFDGEQTEWTARRDIAVGHFKIGNVLQSQKAHEEAIEQYQAFVNIVRELHEQNPQVHVLERDLSSGLGRLRDVLQTLGRTDEALDAHRQSYAITEARWDRNPEDMLACFDLASSYGKEGELLMADGQLDDAGARFASMLELTTRLVATGPSNGAYLRRHAVSFYKLGELSLAHAARATAVDLKRQMVQDAHDWFVRCRDAFIEMRDQDLLATGDAAVPDAIQADVDACLEQLKQLDQP